MTETSFFWNGVATGDATLAPYSDDVLSDFFNMVFCYDRETMGIFATANPSYNQGLLVASSGGGQGVAIANGAAIVDGKLYLNTDIINATVSGNAVYWLIGLSKDFGDQTVRAFTRGPYVTNSSALAGLIQTDGLIWEIPLATILTDASGNVSKIYDQRYIMLKGQIHKINETRLLAAGTVDWTSIPAYFRNLSIYWTAQSANAAAAIYDMRLTFNNDSAANYNHGFSSITPTTDTIAYDHSFVTLGYGIIGHMPQSSAGSYSASGIIEIEGYKDTVFRKVARGKSYSKSSTANSDNIFQSFVEWNSNVAINRIALSGSGASANFAAGSIFTLYGIL